MAVIVHEPEMWNHRRSQGGGEQGARASLIEMPPMIKM